MSFLDTAYGPVFRELLKSDRRRALDEGLPQSAELARLQSLTIDESFAHTRLTDVASARCCLSAIWLLNDFLDESHTISQGIATAEGSFWHAIMHRREGDFSNAKYWFRKVGPHPVYERLAAELPTAKEFGQLNGWDPYEFVDACQSALRSGGAEAELCLQLQQQEWELLFDHCYRSAIGA